MTEPTNLFAIVSRIQRLMSQEEYVSAVTDAKSKAAFIVRDAQNLKFATGYHDRPDNEQKNQAARCHATFVEAEKERARTTLNAELLSIASELEALRAVLPQMAAKMAVEMGVRARALAGGVAEKEAK